MELEVGMEFSQNDKVVFEKTAASIGSGAMEVFSTPHMIALMEKACFYGVAPFLSDEQSTVGTLVNIKHLSATPVGMVVEAKAKLTEIDGKRLVFEVFAHDSKGIIGKGVHERFIIDAKKFMDKVNSKLEG